MTSTLVRVEFVFDDWNFSLHSKCGHLPCTYRPHNCHCKYMYSIYSNSRRDNKVDIIGNSYRSQRSKYMGDLQEKKLVAITCSFLLKSFRKTTSHFIKYCVKMFPCSVAHLLELDWYGKLSILCSHEMTFSHEEKTGKYYEILDVW